MLRQRIAELRLEAAFYSLSLEQRRELAVLEARLRLQIAQQGGRPAKRLARQIMRDSIHLAHPNVNE